MWNTLQCQTEKLKYFTWLSETSLGTTLASELNTLDSDEKHFNYVFLMITH